MSSPENLLLMSKDLVHTLALNNSFVNVLVPIITHISKIADVGHTLCFLFQIENEIPLAGRSLKRTPS